MTRKGFAAAALGTALCGLLLIGCTESPSTTDPSRSSINEPVGPLPAGERARVERVVDGDTLIVDGRRIRLIGVDAPESVKPNSPVECFGPESSAELARLLPRRTPVLLEWDLERKDRFDRDLAYIWLTEPPRLLNAELVLNGFATEATYRPNVAHLAELRAAEDSARAAGRGLWSRCPARTN